MSHTPDHSAHEWAQRLVDAVYNTGFVYGQNYAEDQERDEVFIRKAVNELVAHIVAERADELMKAAPHFVDKPTNFTYYNERLAALTTQKASSNG